MPANGRWDLIRRLKTNGNLSLRSLFQTEKLSHVQRGDYEW
jgi:hypothetical protein